MLANYVENYRRYIIFSNMMEKLFGYMNNYHIKNEKTEELGIQCMKYYKTGYFDKIKKQLRVVLLE